MNHKNNFCKKYLLDLKSRRFSKYLMFFWIIFYFHSNITFSQIRDTILPLLHNSSNPWVFPVAMDSLFIYDYQSYNPTTTFDGASYLFKRNKKTLEVNESIDFGINLLNQSDTTYYIENINFFHENKFLFCERYGVQNSVNYYIVKINKDSLSNFSDSVCINKNLFVGEFHNIFGIKKLNSNLIAIFGEHISQFSPPYQSLNSFIILVDSNFNTIIKRKFDSRFQQDFCLWKIKDINIVNDNQLFVTGYYCFIALSKDSLTILNERKRPVDFHDTYKINEDKFLSSGIINYQSTDSFFYATGWKGFGFGVIDTNFNLSDTNRFLTFEYYNTLFPGHRDWSMHYVGDNNLCFYDSSNIVFGSSYVLTNSSVPANYNIGFEFIKSDIEGNISWRFSWEASNAKTTVANLMRVLCDNEGVFAYLNYGDINDRNSAIFFIGEDGNLKTVQQEINNPRIIIFPNPGSSYFNLQLPFELQGQKLTLALNNSQGQKVLVQEYIGSEVDTEKLPAGVYFYSLFDANGKLLKIDKWVKK